MKKAQHPVGLFSYFVTRYTSCNTSRPDA